MGVRVIESSKQIINRNKEMDEEGMQISCTPYFKGSQRYRLIFLKRNLSNVRGWTLNFNWSKKNGRQTIDTVSTVFFSTRHAVKTWFELLRVKSYRMIRGKYEVMEGSSH